MTLRDTFSTSESTVSSNPLIAGARVAGTEVYNTAGEHLGEIYDVMLDKKTGKVAYAIMSFGGFLGLGEKYHPIPWSVLDFDPERGGYVVPMTKDKLEAAPMYDSQGEPDWDDRTYGKRVHDYYGTMPYWMM
ncbi:MULTISPECIES: PRC-barrel domain-containing protein [Hyphomicrobiales]|uniref:PRC-barrel domain-containing protein n=1 Tax=Bosea massiliensis TaxID=151419 RepID=A0ABW0NYA9_9HYPH|nr:MULTISPECIES: PRC-barrel domain-containing protein [Hyphomicrobiales]